MLSGTGSKKRWCNSSLRDSRLASLEGPQRTARSSPRNAGSSRRCAQGQGVGRSRPWCRQPRRDSCTADEEESFPVAWRSSICSRKSSNYSTANQLYSFYSLLFPKMVRSGLFVFQQQLVRYSQYLPHLFRFVLRICVPSEQPIRFHTKPSSGSRAESSSAVSTSYPYHGPPCPTAPAIYPILSPHLQRAPFRALPAAHVKPAIGEVEAACSGLQSGLRSPRKKSGWQFPAEVFL